MKFNLTYGTAEIYSYGHSGRGNYFRMERYTPNDGSPPVNERVFCAGFGDDSSRHDHQNKYDARCSCCSLNFTHTHDYHQAAVAADQKQAAASVPTFSPSDDRDQT